MDAFNSSKSVEQVKQALRGVLNRIVVEPDEGASVAILDKITRDSLLMDVSQKNEDLIALLDELQLQVANSLDKKAAWISSLGGEDDPKLARKSSSLYSFVHAAPNTVQQTP
jgi:hypothetical protein